MDIKEIMNAARASIAVGADGKVYCAELREVEGAPKFTITGIEAEEFIETGNQLKIGNKIINATEFIEI
jgi:hypothetical protein